MCKKGYQKKRKKSGKGRGEEERRWRGEVIIKRWVGGLSIYFQKAFTVSGKKRLSEASVIGWGIVPDKRAFDEC
jgi:hypothetical protein